ncbi:MAG: hypothetical protein H6659_18680 [Ardenticatenaceae bacterium]|nr:hypothetical protein [Anaerolineales bacterium]MCB8985861.1 hypothetical protein [Ardenticatenaceae bacterium]
MGIQTAKTAILDLLKADSAFSTPLTGGIYAVGVDNVEQISRQDTPDAFDASSELLPCALLKLETTTPLGPYRRSSRQFIVLYVYQQRGHAIVHTALDRAYDLLHKQDVPGAGAWDISMSDVLPDLADDILNAATGYIRFVAIVSQ